MGAQVGALMRTEGGEIASIRPSLPLGGSARARDRTERREGTPAPYGGSARFNRVAPDGLLRVR
jgi:hypothetical protein